MAFTTVTLPLRPIEDMPSCVLIKSLREEGGILIDGALLRPYTVLRGYLKNDVIELDERMGMLYFMAASIQGRPFDPLDFARTYDLASPRMSQTAIALVEEIHAISLKYEVPAMFERACDAMCHVGSLAYNQHNLLDIALAYVDRTTVDGKMLHAMLSAARDKTDNGQQALRLPPSIGQDEKINTLRTSINTARLARETLTPRIDHDPETKMAVIKAIKVMRATLLYPEDAPDGDATDDQSGGAEVELRSSKCKRESFLQEGLQGEVEETKGRGRRRRKTASYGRSRATACVCRVDEDHPKLILCDGCNEWYHPACVGKTLHPDLWKEAGDNQAMRDEVLNKDAERHKKRLKLPFRCHFCDV